MNKSLAKHTTPSKLGYIMPAEWHEHNATWIAWPHNKKTWQNLSNVEDTYTDIVRILSNYERINILVNNKKRLSIAKKKLISSDANKRNVFFYIIKTADAWIRDYGPNFLINKIKNQLAMNSWVFNAWGEKYNDLIMDNGIPRKINEYLNIPIFTPRFILEGGSIDVDGVGTVLTTEQCMLNKNRNPHLSKIDIGYYLREYLGVRDIIWLKNGILGDDTDGHIDDIARFVNPTTVVCCYENKRSDKNYSILKENYNLLLRYKFNDGRKLMVIKLPMPKPVMSGNLRLPASYGNFYIANNVVLVPVFNQDTDKKAIDILQELFRDRKVIGINCVDLVFGLGAIHCITQQEPMVMMYEK